MLDRGADGTMAAYMAVHNEKHREQTHRVEVGQGLLGFTVVAVEAGHVALDLEGVRMELAP